MASLLLSFSGLFPFADVPNDGSDKQNRKEHISDVGIDIHVGDDRFPLGSDGCSQIDEHRIPDHGSQGREKHKQAEAHIRHTGRQGNQTSDQRDKPAEEDRPDAVAVKPGIRFVDVILGDAQDIAVFVHDFFQSFHINQRADPVKDGRADHGSDRGGYYHPDDGKARVRRHKTAESQNHF